MIRVKMSHTFAQTASIAARSACSLALSAGTVVESVGNGYGSDGADDETLAESVPLDGSDDAGSLVDDADGGVDDVSSGVDAETVVTAVDDDGVEGGGAWAVHPCRVNTAVQMATPSHPKR